MYESYSEAPSTLKFVIDVDILDFVRLMEELHVLREADFSHFLNAHFYIHIIAFFKENGRVVNWNTVVNWVDADVISEYLWLDIVRNVIVNWISHVLWQYFLESLLIDLVIIEYLNHYH